MLSQKHLEDICLVYKGAFQCRYLDGDPDHYDKFYCRKKTSDKKILDDLCEDHIRECIKNGVDPDAGSQPIGNNCGGYTFFKDLLQGYDVED